MTAPVMMTVPQTMTTEDVAEYLQVSQAYLKKLRLANDGPRFSRLGRSIRYKLTDVDAWYESRARKQRRR